MKLNISPPKDGQQTILTLITPSALLILGVLVHLLFLVSLRTGWLAPLFEDTMHRFGPGCDFFSIYAAGVKARASESIYTIGGHVQTVPYAYAFRYAPFVAYTLGAARNPAKKNSQNSRLCCISTEPVL